MKIDTLTLNGYRGINEMELSFQDKMNIFIGINGAGKSSVLDAAAVLLSWVVTRLKHSGSSGRPITENDIMNRKGSSSLEIQCCGRPQTIRWAIVKNRRGALRRRRRSDLSDLTTYTNAVQQDISEHNENLNLPLFVYYPVNRAVLDIPLRIRNRHAFTLFEAYDESLTSGANFRTFFEWFREREDLENENRQFVDALSQPDDFQYPDPQLETVRSALTQFMPEFSNLTVRRNPLRMEISKNNERLTVNQLSDGEKCLIAMIGDLARRLAIANPVRGNPLEGRGIALIDEIDLHLHPKWQRAIVPKLRQVFPNIQFILSTHSPHVITHVEPEMLFLLSQSEEGIQVNRPTASYGKNVDRILEDLMGLITTRPDEIKHELDTLYETINSGDTHKALEQLAELSERIGEDPELVKASVLIKRREVLGR